MLKHQVQTLYSVIKLKLNEHLPCIVHNNYYWPEQQQINLNQLKSNHAIIIIIGSSKIKFDLLS